MQDDMACSFPLRSFVHARPAIHPRPKSKRAGVLMISFSLLCRLPGARKLYLEIARTPSDAPFFEARRVSGEVLIWLGRLHLIYTPAGWLPARASNDVPAGCPG